MINPFKYMYHNVLPIQMKNFVENIKHPEMNSKNAYLPIFESTKSLFIHIPKTAGTSVSEALYGEQPFHHPIKVYHQLDALKCKEYFKFGFVRNPWDRLYSTYNYAKKISHPVYRGPLTELAAYDTFEAFVMEWCEKEKIANHFFLKPQFDYLSISGQKVDVDFVGRFESIEADFNVIANKLGKQVSLPKKNVGTNHSKRADIYSPDMADKIAEIYAVDIDTFNYSFE